MTFFRKSTPITILWYVLTIFSAVHQIYYSDAGNFRLFKATAAKFLLSEPLYEVKNAYLYGSIFAALFTPFTLIPDLLGAIIWNLTTTVGLFFALYFLFKPKKDLLALALWICLADFIANNHALQSNSLVAASVIGAYALIKNKKDFWAAVLLMIFTFVKLYSIVGFGLFFFSKNKKMFILGATIGAIFSIVFPMLLTSPTYVVESFMAWQEQLIYKDLSNKVLSFADYSILGTLRNFTDRPDLPNTPFLLFAALLMSLPYLRWRWFDEEKFQILILSLLLLFPVTFSSSAESPTFIIPSAGVAIWYAYRQDTIPKYVLRFTQFFVFSCLIAACMKVFAFEPWMEAIRSTKYFQPASVKGISCFILWLVILYEIMRLPKIDKI